MWKQFMSFLLSIVLVLALPLSATAAVGWSVQANYAKSCSCSPSCPCIYGAKPTQGHCDGTSMVEIKNGHFGDVKLDGITIISAFGTGKWVKYYVSENATEKQIEVVGKLMPSVFGYHKSAKVLAIDKAPLIVERTDTNLKYSAPATTVEIESMRGSDGGPIELSNIPFHGFPAPEIKEAMQYKSVTSSHEGEDKKFSYTGTNGFVGKIDANGTSEL